MPALPPSEDLGVFLDRVVLPAGWRVLYEPVAGSTMDLAREAARRDWPDRSVFVCDFQSAGRGRHGRAWVSPPKLGLLFTVLLRLGGSPATHTMLASVAICEAVERLLGVEPGIKWPNDLLLDDQKLAGVLAESYSGPPGDFTLVGCGVNVNHGAADLAGLGRPATSLRLAAGRPVHRGELLVVCLERVDAWLKLVPSERALALRAAWEQRLWGYGRSVSIGEAGVEYTAVIEGAAVDGALLVRLPDGELRRVLSGEIRLP